jgi:RNA polymerase sigma-70 factor (ECF subfamily)
MTVPVSEDSSSSLLAAVRKQDPHAWLRLVAWIGPFILRWCRGAHLQEADCDEVSSEVLLRIYRGLAAFRKDRPGDSFRGWVYAITRNCIADLLARHHKAPRSLPVELPERADPSEAQDLRQRALVLLVRDAITAHDGDPGFRAFYRTAVDGLSAVEAARELGLSADVVRQHKSRWLKRLRDRLSQQFDGLLD